VYHYSRDLFDGFDQNTCKAFKSILKRSQKCQTQCLRYTNGLERDLCARPINYQKHKRFTGHRKEYDS